MKKDINLADIFQNNMILQRNAPIKIFGTSNKVQTIKVCLNNEELLQTEIPTGDFSFDLPPQKEMFDCTLCIGEEVFENVDIGEVWVAAGQSNMEMELKYTQNSYDTIQSANDKHFRCYTVGRYCYDDEKNETSNQSEYFDKWLNFTCKNAPTFSATAAYFALRLRELNIPVGILSCNYGGTRCATWLDSDKLKNNKKLRFFTDSYNENLIGLDIEQYIKEQQEMKKLFNSTEVQKFMSNLKLYTLHPSEHANMSAGRNISGVIGPYDKNRPSGLYENMLKKVVPYGIKGVIWYQGESDCELNSSPLSYAELFTELIKNWREEWDVELPFLFAQLAPFGEWLQQNGEHYPALRQQQEMVSKSVKNVYMISTSDIGNVYDIHPKNKKTVGERFALVALKHIYKKSDILADAPEFKEVVKYNDTVEIKFANAEGLYIKEKNFCSYNDFSVKDIYEKWLPAITCNINGLQILIDKKIVSAVKCEVKGCSLQLISDEFINAQNIEIKFAATPFYEVNLYNSSNLPVKPFAVKCDL